MFIFIFVCCFLTIERVYCKIRQIATFLEALEFWSIFTCMRPQTLKIAVYVIKSLIIRLKGNDLTELK
jgi:hypothetical protein